MSGVNLTVMPVSAGRANSPKSESVSAPGPAGAARCIILSVNGSRGEGTGDMDGGGEMRREEKRQATAREREKEETRGDERRREETRGDERRREGKARGEPS
eukprot:710091-Hanusia_phi.AAC.1